jgi:hypothetical protein
MIIKLSPSWHEFPGLNKDPSKHPAFIMIKAYTSRAPLGVKAMLMGNKIGVRVSALDCYKS